MPKPGSLKPCFPMNESRMKQLRLGQCISSVLGWASCACASVVYLGCPFLNVFWSWTACLMLWHCSYSTPSSPPYLQDLHHRLVLIPSSSLSACLLLSPLLSWCWPSLWDLLSSVQRSSATSPWHITPRVYFKC